MTAITRRTALGSLGTFLGLGLAGAIPLAPVDAKKKHKHKKRRRRGRRDTQNVPPPVDPGPTDPEPGTCPSGNFRFEDRCAISCDTGCAGGVCQSTVEGVAFCAQVLDSCDDIPIVCTGHEQCEAQELCAQTICGSPTAPLENRCVPLLT